MSPSQGYRLKAWKIKVQPQKKDAAVKTLLKRELEKGLVSGVIKRTPQQVRSLKIKEYLSMGKQDRERLTYFANGKHLPAPKGMRGVGLTNFLSRKWIERFGRDEETGEQLYRLTDSGRTALDAATNSN